MALLNPLDNPELFEALAPRSHGPAPADTSGEDLRWSFPEVDPGCSPFGVRVLLQARRVKKQTAGGILLPEEAREAERDNGTVYRVVACGPLAFRKRESGEPWAEGVWAQVGDYVRAPRWGGDRWTMRDPAEPKEPVLFVTFNDYELIGRVTCDPRVMFAYV